MEIRQDFIPTSNRNRPGTRMTPRFITVHETANRRNGANARMHAEYVKNPTTSVSWHYTVDDGATIYQHLPTNEIGWHAGDGGTGQGNRESIGIEICVNSDGDFTEATENAVSLIRFLMEEHGISINNVVPHQRWTGKNCPATLLKIWDSFIAQVRQSPDVDIIEKPEVGGVQTPSNLLRRGSKGEAVRQLQQDLLKVGESLPRFGVDGDFGAETENAVRSFQRKQNITVDGIVGPQTNQALAKALEASPTPPPPTPPAPPAPSPPPASGGGGQKRTLRNIRPMMTGDDVRTVQRAVGAAVDGIFGPNTEQKVREFQRAQGLTADGIVGPKTWAAIENPRTKPTYSRLLTLRSPNMRGDDVREVQRRLGVTADGIFGPNTERAVRNFQRQQGITVDGKVGPVTWNRLF
ncbi:hypothetical protein AJ85_15885 [Alkalihalobacillus alcalophilus ATCC 27647 = CGMCC 1.3604]|uniref:N-acetylmuramoyl-L-alanine amidase n=3 Tax=Alkalihalobacillus alcalophilus TaxID=1445 RepID=A0A4S4K100_ALKAL|nr:hypothetical protein AJ85_15885 [Alkalihalobacillus alcalophilus ATCC 27647 = CGMCC 1.3604]